MNMPSYGFTLLETLTVIILLSLVLALFDFSSKARVQTVKMRSAVAQARIISNTAYLSYLNDGFPNAGDASAVLTRWAGASPFDHDFLVVTGPGRQVRTAFMASDPLGTSGGLPADGVGSIIAERFPDYDPDRHRIVYVPPDSLRSTTASANKKLLYLQ